MIDSTFEYCVVVVMLILLSAFKCIECAFVPTESMAPTIEAGSYILFLGSQFILRPFQKGDIIVFSPTESLYVNDYPGQWKEVSLLVKRIDYIMVSYYLLVRPDFLSIYRRS